MAIPNLPTPVDNEPISVQEKTIRQFDCPNPDCPESIDITNSNVGTKIQCTACKNVTWLPDYGNKWWQKPLNVFGGIALSFIVGVGSSMTASHFNKEPIEQLQSKQLKGEDNKDTSGNGV